MNSAVTRQAGSSANQLGLAPATTSRNAAEPGDRLAAFRPLIPAIRWGTLALGLLTAVLRGPRTNAVAIWTIVLLAYAVWRTFRPLRYFEDQVQSLVAVFADVSLNVGAVVFTGYWKSPFVFCLITAVMAAGFARGFAFAIRTAILASLTVAIPLYTRTHGTWDSVQESGQWSVELLLVALVAGYARYVFGAAEERHEAALDRISRLAEANALLFSLHQIAQSLPTSLDIDDVLESTGARFRELFDFNAMVVLLWDETSETWVRGLAEGTRVDAAVAPAALRPPLRRAAEATRPFVIADLEQSGGVSSLSQSGLYAPLRARNALVGLLALEHQDANHFSDAELELLDGFVEPAALAIDNARWFSRLRTVGADEERTRIARELHDRVGQSLAYLAFELDRIVKRAESTPVAPDLQQLRQEVRGVISEVRDTLYDLRTDVSEERGFVETVSAFLDRVGERADTDVSLRHDDRRRLPLPQEREMWRIAQEAITNAERHAHARSIDVSWQCDEAGAVLVVADDGQGFPPGQAGRIDSYGLLGMRERADAIGARLEIQSAPGQGTVIRCRLKSA